MRKEAIQFAYQAHYCLSHSPCGREADIWVVFHGYGQLAEFFIRKFAAFDSESRLIVAPEGTNYGYLKEFQGRVGANWMTSYERETAIANNHRFLDRMMENVLANFDVLPRIHVLGFSQGAATATRWASRWPGKVDTLVLWAGGFANDMTLDVAREKFANTQVILVAGDQDELITEASIQKQMDMLDRLQKPGIELNFSGGHELDPYLLGKIVQFEI